MKGSNSDLKKMDYKLTQEKTKNIEVLYLCIKPALDIIQDFLRASWA